jgi:hypothetical protein
MIATSHVIIGSAAAVAVSTVTHNPAMGLATGIVSHFICDSLPHLDFPPTAKFINDEIVWDRKMYTFAITDSLLAFIFCLSAWIIVDNFSFTSMIAWGGLGGYLPDLVDNFPLWRNQIHSLPGFRQFHAFHMWIHNNWRHRYPMPEYWQLGVATQIATVLPCLYYLVK